MSAASSSGAEKDLELAHVLFVDIVGYSRLLINEQTALVARLNELVLQTEQCRKADAAGKLIRIPTGDGMALAFFSSPDAPVRCAMELSKADRADPKIELRMGIHSGPVDKLSDVNQRSNIAGAGINMAQRVMDCGDAGHILLSKHAAEDLEQYGHWQSLLHDLGECEVKHGVRLGVVNLYDDVVGNPDLPKKLKALRQNRERRRWGMIAALLLLAGIIGGISLLVRGRWRTPPREGQSIAVLPFENLSADPQNSYFAKGIQDEILTRIAKIRAIKVISRTSTQQYAVRPANLSEVARQLGVANILEGSVQKAGDEVHINVQLIRASTDEHLWAESYDRKLERIFEVEGEVAAAVADALKTRLSPAEELSLGQKPTSNSAAYDAYLRGIAEYGEAKTLEEQSRSIQPFEEAVRIDPNFSLAWAMLARLHSMWYFGVDSQPSEAEAARRALETAAHLSPGLPEVQLAQAFYQYYVLGDFKGARPILDNLLVRLPNDTDIPSALWLIAMTEGRWDEGRSYIDRAIELNPRDFALRVQAAYVRQTTRDLTGALHYYDEALAIWPDEAFLIAGKASVYQSLGDLDRAETILQKLHPTAKNDTGISVIFSQAKLRRSYAGTIELLRGLSTETRSLQVPRIADYLEYLGELERLSGDSERARVAFAEARAELERAVKEQPNNAASISGSLAIVYAGLGERQLALKSIEHAISLSPASKDAWDGPRFELVRARLAARFGDKDLALSILARLLSISYDGPVTPQWLRLDPDFDSLRDDPGFERLLSEPADRKS